MEKTLKEGSASWLTLLTGKHLLLALITGGIWLIVPILQIRSSKYRLTSERLFVTKGLITKQRRELDLYKLKDLHFDQGIMQRLLGIGDVTVETNGERITLSGIKDPEGMKERIRYAAQADRYEKGITYQERL